MWTYSQPQANILQHYGTLGMKWGVRRYQNSDGTLTKAGKKRSGDQERSELTKKVKELSDDDLRKMINRIQMERQLVSLMTDGDNQKSNQGEKAAHEFLKSSGKIVAAKVASGLGNYLSKKIFDGLVTNIDIKNDRKKKAASENDDKRKANKEKKEAAREERAKMGDDMWNVEIESPKPPNKKGY